MADSNSEGIQWFHGIVNGLDLSDTHSASTEPQTCVYTDDNGNAAVEVFDSNPTTVNVIANFADEGILRFVDVNFALPGGGGTPPPTPPAGSNPPPAPINGSSTNGSSTGNTSGTLPPSLAVVNSIDPSLATGASKVSHSSTQVALARLVTPARGQHYVVVRVNSRSHQVKIRLRLTKVLHLSGGKTHRSTQTITVTISANRLVKITVASSVVSFKVLL